MIAAMGTVPGNRAPFAGLAAAELATAEDFWKNLFIELGEARAHSVETLYDACSRQVFGLALWRTGSIEDASDVVQELILRVIERRQDLRKVSKPRSWLLSVAHRLAIDVGRRRRRSRSDPLEACPLLIAPQDDPARAIDAANASRYLSTLPPKQRAAIYLHHYADCTFQAIGEITGVPTFTAASRYRLGISKLRKLMGEEK